MQAVRWCGPRWITPNWEEAGSRTGADKPCHSGRYQRRCPPKRRARGSSWIPQRFAVGVLGATGADLNAQSQRIPVVAVVAASSGADTQALDFVIALERAGVICHAHSRRRLRTRPQAVGDAAAPVRLAHFGRRSCSLLLAHGDPGGATCPAIMAAIL